MTGRVGTRSRRLLAALALAVCLGVPMTAAQAGGTPSVVASTTSTSASHDSRDAASDDGGRDWLGAVIGGGLLALAGWTLWRSARVRTRYDERRDDPDLRRDDPDMRRDDPDEI